MEKRGEPTHGEEKREKGRKNRARSVWVLFACVPAVAGRSRKGARWPGGSDRQLAASGRKLLSMGSADIFLRLVKRRSFEGPSGCSCRFALHAAPAFGVGGQLHLLVLNLDRMFMMFSLTASSSGAALNIASLAECPANWRAFPQGGIRVR